MLKPLIKISLTSLFSSFFGNRKNKKSGKIKKILLGILGVYIIFAAFSIASSFFFTIGPVFVREDNSWLYFAFAAMLVTLLSVIGSFGIAQSLIYNSKDNDLLLSMPIKISDILLSRISILIFLNYFISALIFIPAGVGFEYFNNFTTFGLVSFILLSLLVPLFTTSISIVCAWLLTVITKRMKHKSIFTFIFALLFFLAYMYVSFNLQNTINFLTFNSKEIAVTVNKYLTLFYLYGSAVTMGNILNFVVFAAIIIAIFVLVIKLLSATFLKLLSGEKKDIKVSGDMSTKQSSTVFALLKKEYERLISFSTYILNTTVGGILGIAFSVMLLIRGESMFEGLLLMPESMNYMVPVLIVTVLAFCSGMNSTTASSISLEGNSINILKSLPITYRDFYNSRILLNLLYGIPMTLAASIIASFGFDGDIIDKLIVIMYPLSLQLFAAIAGLSINMHKPKFDWTNPVYPVKQSANVLIEIICAIGLSVVPIVSCLILNGSADYQLVCLFATVVVLVIDAVIYLHIMKSGKKYFDMM